MASVDTTSGEARLGYSEVIMQNCLTEKHSRGGDDVDRKIIDVWFIVENIRTEVETSPLSFLMFKQRKGH